jgi:hypothetical protein
MNPQPRPPSERQQQYNFLQELKSLKAELKRDVKFVKESLPPYPRVQAFIRNLEDMVQRVEKRVWEFQMQLELTRIRGRF